METKQIRVESSDVFLINYRPGAGKIIISNDDYGYNYSYYWGAMGENTNIQQFLQEINSSYFVGKLLVNDSEFDNRRTFTELRKFIFSELLPYWYKHMEFQKDLRNELNNWQRECSSENEFVSGWNSLIDYRLNYYLIDDRYDREETEKSFKGVCEIWNCICTKPNREYKWLEKFHTQLKNKLKQ